MVRFRKTYLYSAWLLLIILLFFGNWVGLRERYITASLQTEDTYQVAVGDVDILIPGQEMVLLYPSGILVIGGVASFPRHNTTYWYSAWDTDPLTSICVGDFDAHHKGDEIVVLSENGTLVLISKGDGYWETQVIANIPWSDPEWITTAMVSGQLIPDSESFEIVIVGQFFNWSTSALTGRVFVVDRVTNTTWQMVQVHIEANSLLCCAIGDIEPNHQGLELVTAGYNTGIVSLAYTNGTWDSDLIFHWEDTIRVLNIGNFMTLPLGNEIALVKGREIFVLFREGTDWQPRQIWVSNIMRAGISNVIIEDIDPYSPGHELLGIGSVFGTGQPILVILDFNDLFWNTRILWNPLQQPDQVMASNLDFNRDGAEIIITNSPQTAILSIPNALDRIIRAGQVVLIPALILLPTTLVLFALADYIGRASERRRRNYALEMVAKGYIKCKLCDRFVPKDKMQAHLRWHKMQQFR